MRDNGIITLGEELLIMGADMNGDMACKFIVFVVVALRMTGQEDTILTPAEMEWTGAFMDATYGQDNNICGIARSKFDDNPKLGQECLRKLLAAANHFMANKQ